MVGWSVSKTLVAQMGRPRSTGPWGVAGRLEQQESRILAAGAGELLSLGRICRLVRELVPCSSFSRAATLLGCVFALSLSLLYQALVLVSCLYLPHQHHSNPVSHTHKLSGSWDICSPLPRGHGLRSA